MARIRANGRKVAYGVKQYVLDELSDLEQLNISTASPGSTAFIIKTSKKYMLNSKNQWILISTGSSSSGSGGNSGDEDYDGGSIDGTDPDVGEEDEDYDGGSIDGTDPII